MMPAPPLSVLASPHPNLKTHGQHSAWDGSEKPHEIIDATSAISRMKYRGVRYFLDGVDVTDLAYACNPGECWIGLYERIDSGGYRGYRLDPWTGQPAKVIRYGNVQLRKAID